MYKQYVLFTGTQTREDIPAIMARLELPNVVVFSYRHTSAVNTEFLIELLEQLSRAGVTVISAIFFEPYSMSRLTDAVDQVDGIIYEDLKPSALVSA